MKYEKRQEARGDTEPTKYILKKDDRKRKSKNRDEI